MQSQRSRVDRLERRAEPDKCPLLFLVTEDGETFRSWDGRTFGQADLSKLDQDHDLVVIGRLRDAEQERESTI